MVSVPLNQFVMPRPRPTLPGEMPPGTAAPPGQELLFQAPQQPGLLQRLMGGVQPQAAPGAERMGLLGRLTDPQAGWRGKVADNAQALTGFGLGLLSGQGNRDAYGRALQGWQSGSAMDADRQNTEWSRDWMADERDYTRGRQTEADAMSRTRFGWEGQDREAAARQRQAEMASAEATRNQTRDWLISRGYSEAEVPAIMANPSVLGEIMKGAYEPPDRQNMMEVGGQVFDPNTREFIAPPGSSGVNEDMIKRERELRTERTGLSETKAFAEVRAGFERVRASRQLQSGAGDIGLLVGYMKMIDPGSVVREGEFATAEQAQGVPAQILNMYNKLVSGERLSPEARAQFERAAAALYETQARRMEEINSRYSGLAEQYGLDPSRVVEPLPTFAPVENFGTQSGLTDSGETNQSGGRILYWGR